MRIFSRKHDLNSTIESMSRLSEEMIKHGYMNKTVAEFTKLTISLEIMRRKYDLEIMKFIITGLSGFSPSEGDPFLEKMNNIIGTMKDLEKGLKERLVIIERSAIPVQNNLDEIINTIDLKRDFKKK